MHQILSNETNIPLELHKTLHMYTQESNSNLFDLQFGLDLMTTEQIFWQLCINQTLYGTFQ